MGERGGWWNYVLDTSLCRARVARTGFFSRMLHQHVYGMYDSSGPVWKYLLIIIVTDTFLADTDIN